MAEVIWTEPTLNALDEIADYIALEDYEAACRLVSRVFEKIELLEHSPQRGNIPKDLRHTSYRRLVNDLVCVYYRTEGDNSVIVSVDRAESDFDVSRFAG